MKNRSWTYNKVEESAFQVALGATLKRIRKCAGVPQDELGRLLHLHQAALSRVESGKQNLLPWQIQQVSEFFHVGVDELMNGRVNFWSVAERFGRTPPFPTRYRDAPFSKVREFLPLLSFLNNYQGTTFTLKLLDKFGLDPVKLMSPDQKIGVNLKLDIIRESLALGTLNQKNFHLWIDQTRTGPVQGFLHSVYENQSSPIDLIQAWALNSRHYESNFNYEFLNRKNDMLELAISPAEHMQTIQYKDEKLGDVLCQYKRQYLTQFPRYIGASPVHVSEKECHFHGAAKCVYSIVAA